VGLIDREKGKKHAMAVGGAEEEVRGEKKKLVMDFVCNYLLRYTISLLLFQKTMRGRLKERNYNNDFTSLLEMEAVIREGGEKKP
jgi:hypothetical protein